MLYAGTFFWLGMRRPYYFAPVDLIGIMYCAVSVRGMPTGRGLRPALLAVGGLAAVLALSQSWFVLTERKNVIGGKDRMIEFIQSQLVVQTERPLRLYFPTARRFITAEFGSFLEARGVKVARWPGRPADSADVVFESPREFPHGRCAAWIVYRCVQAERPSPGSLVVVLPDDELVPDADRRGLRPPRAPAFEYHPFTEPSVIRPALMRLRSMMDPGWRRLYLREDWLAAYAWYPEPE
jgi:hypothetical protein